MFFVWVVGVAKVVIDFDGLDDARHCFRAKRGNARRHHRMTLVEILSQLVVERANAVRLGGFGLIVMIVFIVVGDAKANPVGDSVAARVDLVGRVRKTTAPGGSWLPGAADNRYSAGGLISASAVRWRANFGSFG